MRIEFTPDPALYPFTSHWFDSSRGRVHYVDEGTGPVILLCHGNPTWSFLYRDIIRGLKDHFRCIAPDYLGFGLSDRPPGSATGSRSMPPSWGNSSTILASTIT